MNHHIVLMSDRVGNMESYQGQKSLDKSIEFDRAF